MILRPKITKEKLEALIKAVEEGGDDDDEITEDEAIAILQGTGLDIRSGMVCLGAVSKSPTVNAPHNARTTAGFSPSFAARRHNPTAG
jgi:hypothetical protein